MAQRRQQTRTKDGKFNRLSFPSHESRDCLRIIELYIRELCQLVVLKQGYRVLRRTMEISRAVIAAPCDRPIIPSY